jgi:hypothetical protein
MKINRALIIHQYHVNGVLAGGCPRIESLLRKSGFWPLFPIKFVKYNKYSPHLIEKMDSKPLFLATASILGQPPNPNISPDGEMFA